MFAFNVYCNYSHVQTFAFEHGVRGGPTASRVYIQLCTFAATSDKLTAESESPNSRVPCVSSRENDRKRRPLVVTTSRNSTVFSRRPYSHSGNRTNVCQTEIHAGLGTLSRKPDGTAWRVRTGRELPCSGRPLPVASGYCRGRAWGFSVCSCPVLPVFRWVPSGFFSSLTLSKTHR